MYMYSINVAVCITGFSFSREIQNDPSGHNPCEDAVAAMELVLLKLKKGKALVEL